MGFTSLFSDVFIKFSFLYHSNYLNCTIAMLMFLKRISALMLYCVICIVHAARPSALSKYTKTIIFISSNFIESKETVWMFGFMENWNKHPKKKTNNNKNVRKILFTVPHVPAQKNGWQQYQIKRCFVWHLNRACYLLPFAHFVLFSYIFISISLHFSSFFFIPLWLPNMNSTKWNKNLSFNNVFLVPFDCRSITNNISNNIACILYMWHIDWIQLCDMTNALCSYPLCLWRDFNIF